MKLKFKQYEIKKIFHNKRINSESLGDLPMEERTETENKGKNWRSEISGTQQPTVHSIPQININKEVLAEIDVYKISDEDINYSLNKFHPSSILTERPYIWKKKLKKKIKKMSKEKFKPKDTKFNLRRPQNIIRTETTSPTCVNSISNRISEADSEIIHKVENMNNIINISNVTTSNSLLKYPNHSISGKFLRLSRNWLGKKKDVDIPRRKE